MSKLRMGIVIAIASALAVFVVGCGDDNEGTTGGGNTTPAATAPATETTPATQTAAAEGDVAAGKTTFEATCQGCHQQGGTVAGAGPVLAGKGLTAEQIETQIKTPRNQMPANLVSGDDLTNVVAFVLSIQ